MFRKRSARLLLLGGLTLALGCRAAPPRPALPAAAVQSDVLLSASPIPVGPPLVLNGPPPVLPGEPRPFSQPPVEPVLPMPKPVPDKIPPVKPLMVTEGPALPLPPVLPPNALTLIPPAVKPAAEAPPVVAPIPADVKFPARDVFVSGPKAPVAPVEVSIVSPPKDTPPLKAGEKFGHAGDYTWVTGVLDRHQRGGYWTIRYADFAEDDRWGGKVRLLDDAKLKGFQSGDVVRLEGELLAPTTADATGAFPPYRVTGVKLVEKGR